MKGTNFNEVEVAHDNKGKPELILNGDTKREISNLAIVKISVSLSHLKTIAAAVVIIETVS